MEKEFLQHLSERLRTPCLSFDGNLKYFWGRIMVVGTRQLQVLLPFSTQQIVKAQTKVARKKG